MRWQKPYHHVLADDYLKSHTFLTHWGAYANDINPEWFSTVHEFIGPHEHREMNLMVLGIKPCALIDSSKIGYWAKTIEDRRWIVERSGFGDGNCEELIVALPDQHWRVKRLHRLDRETTRDGYSLLGMVRLGYLLGYTKECIRAFLDNRSRLEESVEYVGFVDAHMYNL